VGRQLAALFVGAFAFALVAQPAHAETPTSTATATATGTPSAGAPVAFTVSEEGKAQLLRLLRMRFMPPPARSTLAAMLEQEGVQHEVLVKLFEKPRHCEDGQGRDGERSWRCSERVKPLKPIAFEARTCAEVSADASAPAKVKEFCAETALRASTKAAMEAAQAAKKQAAAATQAAAGSEACAQALALGNEKPGKLLEACLHALKSDAHLAASICAGGVTAVDTKAAAEIRAKCARLAAAGDEALKQKQKSEAAQPASKPPKPPKPADTQVKPVQ
jgi:hypothetical protein